jgi:dipeptidyl aminopeptidase/acylaminoacyl peptidase
VRPRPGFLLLLATAACASPGHSPASRRADIEPTLAQIFGKSLDGARPSDPALSADGRFVSYRYAAPPEEGGGPEAPASRPRTFVAAAAGGTAWDLGEIAGATWFPAGSDLLWCSGNEIKVWKAGEAVDRATVYAKFAKEVSGPRFSPDGKYLLVSSEGKQWILATADPKNPRATGAEKREGYAFDRMLQNEGRPFVVLRRKTPVTESKPATAPAESAPAIVSESGPASREASAVAIATETAPASGPTSAPASRPARTRYAIEPWDWERGAVATLEFDAPENAELETAQVAEDNKSAIVVFRAAERGRGRGGMVADFLSAKVTTRPARASSAADRETQRCAFVATGSALVPVPGLGEMQRCRIETVAVRGKGPAFIIGFTAEDRKRRAIYSLDLENVQAFNAAGPAEAPALRSLLEVPGPSGGVEMLLSLDGDPLALSEASGRSRAYALGEDRALRAFTPPGVDVHWLRFANGAAGARSGVAMVADPERPHERELWRYSRDGSGARRLPVDRMFLSSPVLSRDGSTVAFLGATLGTTEDLYAMPADGSAPPRKLTSTSPDPKTLPGGETPLRIVRFPSLDGTHVSAMLYEPPEGVRPNGAAVIFIHGAGYLQQVRASTGFGNYTVNHHFHRRLARLGYVVLAPDFRGSAGYGRQFRVDVFQKLGLPDSDDIVASKRWLAANCGIDPERVGIYGGSYGGFLTLMCLFRHPREFAAGAALRSVTDWRSYTAEYTRPLLGGGPEEVPDVYKLCSPIDQASNLERPLLLLHGMMDDNVFAQDTIRLVEVLQKAGKTQFFELMLYPSQNHSFTAAHSWIDEYQRIEDFFAKHLRVERP